MVSGGVCVITNLLNVSSAVKGSITEFCTVLLRNFIKRGTLFLLFRGRQGIDKGLYNVTVITYQRHSKGIDNV